MLKMTRRTRIKVCGITTRQDAEAAVDAGADGLGFIFADHSPRKVTPAAAKKIISRLPPFVDAVGVFVDEALDVVEKIVGDCRLTIVQLHGSESTAYCGAMPCRVIKAFRVGPELENAALTPYADMVKGFLLDTYHKNMAGGTGKTFNWRLVQKTNPPGPIILAGGLSPANVIEAIKQVRPFAVDVNSGVEYKPGRKDINKLKEFVKKVRMADNLN